MARACATYFLLLFARPHLLQAASDVVVTTSGDRLVGEIKRLEKKVLVLSTDYSDSDFLIKWEKVAHIESSRTYVMETFQSVRSTGTLAPTPAGAGSATIDGERVSLPDLASIQPVERSFWSRFDAGFSLGFSGTRANSAKQFTAGGNFSYQDDLRLITAAANLFSSRQANAPRTQRWDVHAEHRRFLGKRLYATGSGSFLGSLEQGLDLRSTLGGGVGAYLRRSTSEYFALGGGVAWTNERYGNPALPIGNSAEAFAGFDFRTERLRAFDLFTQIVALPSLTVTGRYRLNYRTDLDFNLPGDWFFRTGLYGNFDSKPPAGGLSRNDYGWTNSFGLKF